MPLNIKQRLSGLGRSKPNAPKLIDSKLQPTTAVTPHLDYSQERDFGTPAKPTPQVRPELPGVESSFQVHKFSNETKAREFFEKQRDQFVPSVTPPALSDARMTWSDKASNTVVDTNRKNHFISNTSTFGSEYTTNSGLLHEPRSKTEANIHGKRVSQLQTRFDPNQVPNQPSVFKFRQQIDGKTLVEQEPFIKTVAKDTLKQWARFAASVGDTVAVVNAIRKGNRTPTLPERNLLIGLSPLLKRTRASNGRTYAYDVSAQEIRNATATKTAARMSNKANAGEKPSLEEYGQLEGGIIEPDTLVRLIQMTNPKMVERHKKQK